MNTQNIANRLLSKVPEITVFFWIIKILCTTIGETAADFMSTTLNLGLTWTTVIMTIIFAVVLFYQFRAKKYVPSIYWLAVTLISVVGTLITDNLTDNLGVSLVTTTIVFAIALGIVFIAWYAKEKTLSIHSIFTRTRESFYWLAILFTFALGTAAGDLLAERLDLGYLLSLAIFAAAIAAVYAAYKIFKLNAVFSFWVGYILTRPLGASIGDFLTSAKGDGGLGFGTTATTLIFLAGIIITVVYLTKTKKDAPRITA